MIFPKVEGMGKETNNCYSFFLLEFETTTKVEFIKAIQNVILMGVGNVLGKLTKLWQRYFFLKFFWWQWWDWDEVRKYLLHTLPLHIFNWDFVNSDQYTFITLCKHSMKNPQYLRNYVTKL